MCLLTLREIDFITSSFQHHDMLIMLTNELMYLVVVVVLELLGRSNTYVFAFVFR